MTEWGERFENALLSLDRLAIEQILARAHGAEHPFQFIDEVIVPALEHIGFGWEHGRLALSQVYMSGRLCEDLVASLLPPDSAQRKQRPRLAIAALEDYHLLGKQIVTSLIKANGFAVIDYDRLSVEEAAQCALRDQIDLFLLSVLMLPSALKIKDLRHRLDQEGWRGQLIVGGAPFLFDATLWKTVGADAMGKNAADALKIITAYTSEGNADDIQ